MFIRLLHLIVKELLASLRDPQARALLIGPPILQIFIFSYAITQEIKNVSLAVYNQDVGKEGYALVQRFAHSPTFVRIVTLTHHDEIDPVIDRQDAMAVLVIPQDFSQTLHAGRQASLQILLDGRRSNAAPIVGGYMTKIINRFIADQPAGRSPIGISVETRNWFNVNLDPRRTTIPCLVCVLATVLGMITAGLSIAREREMGTFEQLLVSPLTPTEILIGKAIPAVFLAACSAVMLIGIAVFIFRIPLEGSLGLLIGSLILYLLTIVGIGLFVSSLALTQQQAILGVILVLPPSIMLSGFATPVENMPNWLQWLTVINPVRWYLVIVKGVFMKGMGIGEVLRNCIPLVALSAVTLTAAAIMFRRRME